MSQQHTRSEHVNAAADAQRATDIIADLRQIATDAATVSSLLSEGFRAIARHFAVPFGAVNIRLASGNLDDYWHSGPSDPKFWRSSISELIDGAMVDDAPMTRLYRSKQNESVIALMAFPVRSNKASIAGAIGLVVTCRNRDEATTTRRAVQNAAEFMTLLADQVQERLKLRDAAQSTSGLDALVKAAGSESQHQLAFAITNNLRNRLGCEQVAIGSVRSNSVNVLSISGFDLIKQRNPGVRLVRGAMEEAADRGRPIVCQSKPEQWDEEVRNDGHRLNDRWRRHSDNAAIATIPLLLDDTCHAVLALRGRPGQTFSTDQINKIQASVSEYIGPLRLVDRAGRSFVRHGVESAREWCRDLIRPRSMVRRAIVIFLIGIAAWAAFGTIGHRVPVTCRVVPSEVLHFSAPIDGRIAASHVVPGDMVTAGQILFEMDGRDLRLERDRIRARLEVADIEIDRLTVENDIVGAQLAQAERAVDEAALRTIDHRLEQLVVRAPQDGVVLQGDLRKSEGRVVTRGEALLTIGPSDNWRFELEVDEAAIAYVEPGMTARFASDARPDVPIECIVERILPSAEVRDGRNIFVVEARAQDQADWIRTGMEGVARIDAGRAPVWWVYGHRFMESIHRTFWL